MLHFLDAGFHHVTNGNDAGQPPLFDNRDVTEFSGGHALHQIVQRVAFMTGHDLARHHFGHRHLERLRAVLRKCAHNVTFRKNTDNTLLGAGDDERTDTLLAEQLHRRSHGSRRLDGGNGSTLAGQHGFHSHGRLPVAPLARQFTPPCAKRRMTTQHTGNGSLSCGYRFATCLSFGFWRRPDVSQSVRTVNGQCPQ